MVHLPTFVFKEDHCEHNVPINVDCSECEPLLISFSTANADEPCPGCGKPMGVDLDVDVDFAGRTRVGIDPARGHSERCSGCDEVFCLACCPSGGECRSCRGCDCYKCFPEVPASV